MSTFFTFLKGKTRLKLCRAVIISAREVVDDIQRSKFTDRGAMIYLVAQFIIGVILLRAVYYNSSDFIRLSFGQPGYYVVA